ncbi:MAG TPA: amidohydrolase family protein [Cellulomonas sp.]
MSTDRPVLVTAGAVRTMVPSRPVAAGLLVAAGRIAEVCTPSRVAVLRGSGVEELAFPGACVVPGINDGHAHPAWLGHRWPHTLIGPDGFAPPHDVPRAGDARAVEAAVLSAQRHFGSLGVTSYTEGALGPGEDDGLTGVMGSATIAAYRALAGAGRLRVRVTVMVNFGLVDGVSDLAAIRRGVAGTGFDEVSVPGSMVVLRGLKVFADGIPPARTAWRDRPYRAAEGDTGSPVTGAPLVGPSEEGGPEAALRLALRAGVDRGVQVAVHATGERAVQVCLEELGGTAARLRHYVVHADLATPAQVAAMGLVGLGATIQPRIATFTHGALAATLGPSDLDRYLAVGAMLRAGVPLTVSSDAPVLAPDWRADLADVAGRLGWADRVDPERTEVLLATCTRDAARQDGAESWKGVLAPGFVADLAVLARDPFEIAPAALPEVEVVATLVGGVLVHDGRPGRPGAASA